MRRFAIVHTLLLAVSLSSLMACAANTDAEDASQSSDDELKKKIKPKGGNGGLDLAKPSWTTTAAVGQYVFDNVNVLIDTRTEKVPGTYALQTRAIGFDGGQTMNQSFSSIAITAGNIEKRTATGLRVRFDQPLTFGAARYDMVPSVGGIAGFLQGRGGAWSKKVDGVLMFVAPGTIKATNASDLTGSDVTFVEGKLSEVVLPTSKLAVQVDDYDAAYPTPANCQPPYVSAGAPGDQESLPVRDQAGKGFVTAVIPHGARASAVLNSYGIQKTLATAAGQTVSFLVNRLEVDDVEVSTAGGGTQTVRGTFNVEYKDVGGVYRSIACSGFATHSGIDLPDGAYRITSRASSNSGVVTSVEEVSFP